MEMKEPEGLPGHPIVKMVAMILQLAVKDQVKLLSFVYLDENKLRMKEEKLVREKEEELYVLADNRFLASPPDHLFHSMSQVLKVFSEECKERNLVGTFTYEDYQRENWHELRWDILFLNASRDLNDELQQLFRITYKKAQAAANKRCGIE